jgi:peptidyl-prolyl cis-trans isomerase SurA
VTRAILLAVLAVPIAAEARIVERILAIVDDEVLLQSEIEEREAPFRSQIDSAPSQFEREEAQKRLRCQVLGDMIDERLLERQAQKLHLTVTPAEVDRASDNVRNANRMTEAEFAQALADQGYTMTRYRSDLRRQLLELKVVNARVAGRVSVTDAEVRDEYNRTVRDLRARDPFRGAMIFLSVPAGAGAVVAAKQRDLAADLARRAGAGEDFAALARRFSEDEGTRDSGGDLGERRRGELAPHIDDALLDMAPGDVRGPVRAPDGWMVLKLVEREQTGVRAFEEVRDGIRQDLIEREMSRQRRLFLREQARQTFIERRVQCGT